MQTPRFNVSDSLATLLLLSIFVFDVLTPRGVAGGMLYVLPVLFTLWSPTRRSTPLVATVCVLLTLIGYIVSPDGMPLGFAISNRVIAVVTITAVAAVCMARRSAREAMERATCQLAEHAAALVEANARLEQSNAELEQAVRRRAQAELDLLRSNRELEEFAYVAAHDLTAPLRHVASFLELLERNYGHTLDEKAKDYIATASRSAKHMQALIGDLLTLARLDSQKQSPGIVDCNGVFDQVLALLEPAITEMQATVTRDAMPSVLGVERQLVQVLENLIGNALKYRSEQAPHIHVSAIQRDGEWVLCVRDNGIGIDPKHSGEIFKIFRRLHSTDEYPGTGIGLALCQRIIERHEGRIWLENAQPGAGSTFCFSLPNGTPTDDLAA